MIDPLVLFVEAIKLTHKKDQIDMYQNGRNGIGKTTNGIF
jgi:hypothetical protein